MSRAKPYPSDPALRAPAAQVDDPTLARTIERFGDVDVDELTVEDRRRLGESAPVTPPTPAPPGLPSPNSVRAREEGLGVDPAVTEANLEALAELAAAPDDGSGPDVHPDESAAAEAERQKRDERNARRREQRAAKKAAAAKKAPAKKAAAKKASK